MFQVLSRSSNPDRKVKEVGALGVLGMEKKPCFFCWWFNWMLVAVYVLLGDGGQNEVYFL
jgi:hypothetical protein